MYRFLRLPLVAVLLLGFTQLAAAEGEKAIIEKALKAHGGADKLNKFKAVQTKTTGKLDLLGGINFTSESTVQFPDKFKEVSQLEIMGQQVTATTIYDGKKVYINVNGNAVPVSDKIEEEVKDVMRMGALMRMAFLADKGYELASLGETQVNDRPAVGVRVSRKGAKDVSLYFDKKTGLVAKVERRGVDPMSGQEFTEERIIKEYQDKEGMKAAKKLLINRDGNKYMELDITEVKFLENVDDSEFKQP
jgi:hypothetical protein